MAPVILKTFVHCPGCAGRIRRAIKKYLGVEEVIVSVDTGLILISGTNHDASFLKWQIQSKIVKKCRVDIISNGTADEPQQYAAPPPGYPYDYYSLPYPAGYYSQPPPPVAYPYYGGAALGRWVPAPPPQHLLQYVPAEELYSRQQYMPNEAWFHDDNPNGCCSVQ